MNLPVIQHVPHALHVCQPHVNCPRMLLITNQAPPPSLRKMTSLFPILFSCSKFEHARGCLTATGVGKLRMLSLGCFRLFPFKVSAVLFFSSQRLLPQSNLLLISWLRSLVFDYWSVMAIWLDGITATPCSLRLYFLSPLRISACAMLFGLCASSLPQWESAVAKSRNKNARKKFFSFQLMFSWILVNLYHFLLLNRGLSLSTIHTAESRYNLNPAKMTEKSFPPQLLSINMLSTLYTKFLMQQKLNSPWEFLITRFHCAMYLIGALPHLW